MGGVCAVRIFDGTQCRDMTAEELTALERGSHLAAIADRYRPMNEYDVTRLFITQKINELEVDDRTALRMKDFYPEWATETAYQLGNKITRNGKLWRVRQAHTSQAGWEPENVPSLWEEINEIHSGTVDDPIPYDGNMVLAQGKYYDQDEAIYLCIRDTGNPVYHNLADLVGLYVEIA
jgi:hypothetical protein